MDKLLPRKRSSIKTLCAKLKQGMGVEHSRPRSLLNAFVHLLSCRAATPYQPKVNIATVPIPDLS